MKKFLTTVRWDTPWNAKRAKKLVTAIFKKEKNNKGEFAKMFESGWCECFGGR